MISHALRHDVFARAITFGVFEGSRASLEVDTTSWKILECFNKDLSKLSLVLQLIYVHRPRSMISFLLESHKALENEKNAARKNRFLFSQVAITSEHFQAINKLNSFLFSRALIWAEEEVSEEELHKLADMKVK